MVTESELDQTPLLERQQLTLSLLFSCLSKRSLNILLFHTSQNHIETWNNYLSKYRRAIYLFIKLSFVSYKTYTFEFQWCFKLAKTDQNTNGVLLCVIFFLFSIVYFFLHLILLMSICPSLLDSAGRKSSSNEEIKLSV